jgi:hypothetical protein
MTDEEEFAARSLLKWQRVNALEWVCFTAVAELAA